MLIRFWGTRGSLPAPLTAPRVEEKVRSALLKSLGKNLASEADVAEFMTRELDFVTTGCYGGNTSCVEVDIGGDEFVICDFGSGAREFGNRVMSGAEPDKKFVYNVFLSHVHWDHINGFPFFVPAYVPGHRVVIHSCHEHMEMAFRQQHSAPWFPVDFTQLSAEIEFVKLEPDREYSIAGLKVTPKKQYHAGDSYGYRFEANGKSAVFSTDSEHKFGATDEEYGFVEFFRGADLVIFDAMYTLADAYSIKEDWGHSSNIVGVELAHRAGAKHLCLFHHDPNSDDATLQKILEDTIRFEAISQEGQALKISSAYDGLEIRL